MWNYKTASQKSCKIFCVRRCNSSFLWSQYIIVMVKGSRPLLRTFQVSRSAGMSPLPIIGSSISAKTPYNITDDCRDFFRVSNKKFQPPHVHIALLPWNEIVWIRYVKCTVWNTPCHIQMHSPWGYDGRQLDPTQPQRLLVQMQACKLVHAACIHKRLPPTSDSQKKREIWKETFESQVCLQTDKMQMCRDCDEIVVKETGQKRRVLPQETSHRVQRTEASRIGQKQLLQL